MGWLGYSLPLWLQQSLINGISWNGISWVIVISEHLQRVLRLRGITKSGRHSTLKITCGFLFFFFFFLWRTTKYYGLTLQTLSLLQYLLGCQSHQETSHSSVVPCISLTYKDNRRKDNIILHELILQTVAFAYMSIGPSRNPADWSSIGSTTGWSQPQLAQILADFCPEDVRWAPYLNVTVTESSLK